MSIEDDIALLNACRPCVCSATGLRVLAIGSETRNFVARRYVSSRRRHADAGFVVKRGSFRVTTAAAREAIAGPGALIGELALGRGDEAAVDRDRAGASTVIRISRSLFQRVLESDPAAAHRLRDEFASRTGQIASDLDRRRPLSSRTSLRLQRHRHRHVVGWPLPAARVAGDLEIA